MLQDYLFSHSGTSSNPKPLLLLKLSPRCSTRQNPQPISDAGFVFGLTYGLTDVPRITTFLLNGLSGRPGVLAATLVTISGFILSM